MIFLTQKIKFSEGRGSDLVEIRRQKQLGLCHMLELEGFDIIDNNDLILGIFDTNRSEFLNATSEKFLLDFMHVSILKGHFMGNKGYQLKIDLPDFPTFADEPVHRNERPSQQDKNRQPSLLLRYKVLERDQGKCVLCGRTPREGVTLHVDHVVPWSRGGLTTLSNLQTLCNDCNFGKGNRSETRFGA